MPITAATLRLNALFIANTSVKSLHASREHCLELRVLFFPRNHAHFEVAKAGVLEQLMQFYFAEPKPAVCIKVARFFEAMAQEIENNDAAALFQNAVGGADCALGFGRVMQ